MLGFSPFVLNPDKSYDTFSKSILSDFLILAQNAIYSRVLHITIKKKEETLGFFQHYKHSRYFYLIQIELAKR